MSSPLLTICGACAEEIPRGAIRCASCGAPLIGRHAVSPVQVDWGFDGAELTVSSTGLDDDGDGDDSAE